MALATAHVEILADTSKFEKDLTGQLRKTGASAGKAFSTSFGKATTRVGNQGGRAGKQFAKNFSKTASKIEVSTSFTGKVEAQMGKSGSKAGKQFGSSLVKSATAPLAGLGKMITSVVGSGGGGKMFSPITVGAGAAAAAVAPLAGYLAALPAVLAGAAAAAGTLAVAFQGVGGAISAGWSGDMAAFRESLTGLAPAAQSVARGIVALKPAFDGLKAATQQAFFAPLVGQMGQLNSVINGPLRAGITNLAGALGGAAKAVVNFFASPAGSEAMRAVFDGIANSIRQITPAIGPLLQGFTDIAAAAAGMLGGAAGPMASFGKWLSKLANSGQIAEWLNNASIAARQLGAAFAFVQPYIPQLMAAFGKIGTAVRNLFVALGPVIQAVMPIIISVFGNIAGVIQGITGIIQGVTNVIRGIFNGDWPQIWKGLQQIVGGALRAIWNLIQLTLVGRVLKIIKGFGPKLLGFFRSIWDRVVNIAKTGIDKVVTFVRGLGTKIKDAVVGAGKWLYQAGKNILNGLINGIKSKIGGIGKTMGQVAGKIRNFLPFSPAKEGPLSGSGNPESSGKKIGSMLADGINARQSMVAGAMHGLTASGIPHAPMPIRAQPMRPHSNGFGTGDDRDRRVTNHTKTTTVSAPISVHTVSADPAQVARRTANRLARLATA